jgi:hypothetical protein
MHDIYLILNLIWTHCGNWDLITDWLIVWAVIRGFKALETWGDFLSRRGDRKL